MSIKTHIPLQSITNVVEYLWEDEQRHYLESLSMQEIDGVAKNKHIFEDVRALRKWLNAVNGKKTKAKR